MTGGAAEKKWYIVHTYSGFEQKVSVAIKERAKAAGLEHLFGEILVPTEKIIEVVKGKKRSSSRKFYPGYIIVQMVLNDETWHLVRTTPKVTGLIGSKDKPVPIPEEEVERIKKQMEEGTQKPRPKYWFEKGDQVRVEEGPFANFHGVVDEVLLEKGKVRVLVSIFGRPTPVELYFTQVTRL
ncbi:MAG: transcription termination/antitermination protein NusG [Thermodesulforhabdaceae bacterium]